MAGSCVVRHYSLYLFAFGITKPFHKSAIQRLQRIVLRQQSYRLKLLNLKGAQEITMRCVRYCTIRSACKTHTCRYSQALRPVLLERNILVSYEIIRVANRLFIQLCST
ncbi:hypothetical protein D3C72_2250540 [compost metagenome]